MDDHRDRLSAVLIGVGAAFDYHAGTLRRAPLLDAAPWPRVVVPTRDGATAALETVPRDEYLVPGARHARIARTLDATPGDALTRRALIVGITGQDGSFLTELLLSKGYHVYGIIRRSSSFNTGRIDHLYQDPTSQTSAPSGLWRSDRRFILEQDPARFEPHEIYNLGAQSHVHVSFDVPEYTGDVDGLGTLRLLEGIRDYGDRQPSSTKLLPRNCSGGAQEFRSARRPRSSAQSLRLLPRSTLYWITVNYRESTASSRRQRHSVQSRIRTSRRNFRHAQNHARGGRDQTGTAGCATISGICDAQRDWGYARDYVEAMWLMLQQDVADDYVSQPARRTRCAIFSTRRSFGHADFDLLWTELGRSDSQVLPTTAGR